MFEFELEALKLSLRSISQRKWRSFLTILGIAIGITAIISLVSIGEGLKYSINQQIEKFGANKIIVMPFSSFGRGPRSIGTKFSEKDVDKIEKVKGIDVVSPFLVKTLEVSFKKNTNLAMVVGLEPEKAEKIFKDVQGYELYSGRFLKRNDKFNVVLGYSVAKKMFEGEIKVGDKIIISGKKFKVVGILNEVGNQYDDNSVMMPIETLRELTQSYDEITMIMVGAKKTFNVEKVAKDIEDVLSKKHDKGTFSVLTTRQLAERITIIATMLSIFLGGIAAISLIVAGIGIANTMLMSVMERTREIGIMKAIGATNSDVLKIFLIESIVLSLVGGFVGTILGVLASSSLERVSTGFVMMTTTLKTHVDIKLILFSLAFSGLVGIIFGLWPAYKAAKLDPVEALRYE